MSPRTHIELIAHSNASLISLCTLQNEDIYKIVSKKDYPDGANDYLEKSMVGFTHKHTHHSILKSIFKPFFFAIP